MRQALLVGVVGLVVASSAAAALTPAAYRAKATHVCATARAVTSTPAQRRTRTGLLRFLRKAIPVGERYVAGLRALSPPTALEETHARLVAVVTAEVSRLRVLADRLEAGATPSTVLNDAVVRRLGTRESALWAKLGIHDCPQ